MKKAVEKDTVGNIECYFNPELLFCSDATVVDYLNALLESEPAMNMDFREIHFVHQDVNSNSNTTAIIGNAMLLNGEYSKTEVDELRSENENLKFRIELTEIDAQVLRGENGKLKTVKEHLIAQLREIKEQLNTLRAENDTMRQAAKSVRHLPDPPLQRDESRKERVPEAVALPVEKTIDEKVEPAAEQPEPCEEPQQEPELQLEPESVAIVEERRNDYNPTVITEQEREFFAHANITNEGVKKRDTPDVTVFSRKNVVQRITRKNSQASSTLIKRQSAEKSNTRKDLIVKTTSQYEAPLDNRGVDMRQKFLPQPQVAEVEKKLEEAVVPAAITAVLPLKDGDEIVMPPAPASKVAIRRNAKFYEDVQKDSDPNKVIETGHNLVL